jgi:peptidoglycan hydrolase-like protein with peptidoglycan-binding domain
MCGDDVREVQKALVAKGHDPKGIDAAFGPRTEKAVISFQKSAGVKADGIVTRDVWDKLIG